ncbi:MAG TPA: hypothetical protein VG055_08735 [Planctomycetaceae bacterium]|jgi:hypothetical protein|nr:hypothetical protein [Planctomycetaceae bacterium]
MNDLELLRQLGARAHRAAEPRIDVVASVIQRIARRRTRAIDARLSLVSVCACALSALAIAAALPLKPDEDNLGAISEAATRSTSPEAFQKVLEP